MKNTSQHRGSIALMSILIISAFTLIVVLGMSQTNILTSLQWQNTTSDKKSYYMAEQCLEEGLRRLKDNTSFTNETLTFDGGDACVVSVTGASPKTITVTTSYGSYQQSYSGQVTVTQSGTANNIRLLNWTKI